MKTLIQFLALVFLTLSLSGCATSSCKKTAQETPVTDQAVVASAVPEATVVASAAPAAPVVKKIPAAVMK